MGACCSSFELPSSGPGVRHVIEGAKGVCFYRDGNSDADSDYNVNRYQYATSSLVGEGHMEPSLIFYPDSLEDIQRVVKYARLNKIAVALRTGGHQYCGVSSTAGNNIQMDLSKVFKRAEDLTYDPLKNLCRISVSHSLSELNAMMRKHGFFVPHGQCFQVHVGGHVQTGGYGMLLRSFGLFSDHVVELEIVDSLGNVRKVTRATNKDLFFAILGGSPGNFAVITHVTLKPQLDAAHSNSRGLKAFVLYDKRVLESLLQIVAEHSVDGSLAKDYDLSVTVLSSREKLLAIPSLDDFIRVNHPDAYGPAALRPNAWPPVIVVMAQWANLGGKSQTYDPSYFDRIKDAASLWGAPMLQVVSNEKHTPMSQLSLEWVYHVDREFDSPYEKRAYNTRSSALASNGFADWLAGRIDAMQTSGPSDCNLSFQIQPLGSKNSTYYDNRDNGTSFNHRDLTCTLTLDCFLKRLYFSTKKGKCSANKVQGDLECFHAV